MNDVTGAAGRPRLRGVLRVVIVAAVLLALLLVETTSRSGVLWRLTTFTYQVNVLAAVFYAWSLFSARADARPGLRGAVVLYVVVAGLVWNVFLTDQSMGYTPANVLLHVVMPVLALTDWLLVGRSQGDVRWWQPIAWLAYPVAYLGLALAVLNEAGRRAPYYFLDPDSVGTAAVVGNIGLLALGFVGLGYVITALGRASVAARARVPEPVA
ncbi:hypothetical protein EV383_3601 [Pseudonocardia sediminis]|uniref:FAR-17a/AIG1-like protein n=1 Tax=Pseudonocardia sediminis TaxID=1397368 RepID=A0A4Q7UZX6_PSEST|nr:Pr6Pr family membrane protein [Pseudonocardia sediminis]RZT86704.1 hypothetical protein EV383_3601 [Pseudonocardia sediminis]